MAARTLRVPAWAFGMLALSAFLGNAAQWVDRSDLKSAQDASKEQTECRGRISGYVEGLSITNATALGSGLLALYSEGQDSARFRQERDLYDKTTRLLREATPYREQSVSVCAKDPDFDPETISGAGR